MFSNNLSNAELRSFLNCGALLRWENYFYLLTGPFSVRPDSVGLQVFSPDFFMTSNLDAFAGETSFKISIEDFKSKLNHYLKTSTPAAKFEWREPDFEAYKKAFGKIKDEMKLGVLKKAVPVLFARSSVKLTPVRKAQILKNLCDSSKQLFVYGLWTQSEGMLGATPEILTSAFSRKLRSMALAGTQLKSTGPCRLLEDPKERLEHAFVVEDIIKVLANLSGLETAGPEILDLPSLWHIKTEIRATMEAGTRPLEIIRALHPTPALGVSPRSFDFHWMRDLPEARIRHKFGAPFAIFLPNQDFICLVAIRNIQWNENEILLGAGGGIVHSSVLEKEWLELEGKRNSVKTLMGI